MVVTEEKEMARETWASAAGGPPHAPNPRASRPPRFTAASASAPNSSPPPLDWLASSFPTPPPSRRRGLRVEATGGAGWLIRTGKRSGVGEAAEVRGWGCRRRSC